MYRRTLLVVALVVVLSVGSVQSAFAWGNGGNERNGYGTHDWLLDKAIEAAGEKANWVDVNAALLASDDPDSLDTSKYLHVYKEFGRARGGPQQAADEYGALMVAYQAGDYAEASRLLGVMSHYYTDIAQPFHAKYTPDDAKYTTKYGGTRLITTIHRDYELAAEDYALKGGGASRLVVRERRSVSDVRTMAVGAAKYARARYGALVPSFAASGKITGGAARDVTDQVFSRAVNDLADIIASVPAGEGLALPPASMRQKMSKPQYYYPRKAQFIRSHVICLDAAGKPMEGVRVWFTWPGANGTTRTYAAYSDAAGLAYNWQNISSAGTLKKLPLTSKVSSSGQVKTNATWYMQTPRLATGAAGVKTTLSTTSPRRNTVVRVRTKLVSTTGKPVKNVRVKFTWYHKNKKYTTTAVTDSRGIARSSRNIGSAARGYRVWVKGETYCGGTRRYSRAAFTPR